VTREDLDLIDALVWAGCLSRPAAREVASQATPGRIATYIIEKGFAPLIAPPQVIIERLAKYEAAEEEDRQRGMDRSLSRDRDYPETD
jgi:hypothetical protein